MPRTVLYGDHTDACQLGTVDHAAIARACGCEGIRVEDPSELAAALRRAAKSAVTTVVDVIIDPKAYPPITIYEGRWRGRRSPEGSGLAGSAHGLAHLDKY
jgi:acetolactate synthase-1/2/3 large subunit